MYQSLQKCTRRFFISFYEAKAMCKFVMGFSQLITITPKIVTCISCSRFYRDFSENRSVIYSILRFDYYRLLHGL